MIEALSQPWHWSVSGLAIALIMFLMIWLGKSFGISTSYNAVCGYAGLGKRIQLFDRDLSKDTWRMLFVLGALIGGYLAINFLASPEAVDISDQTIASLQSMGYDYPSMDDRGHGFVPTEIFALSSPYGIVLALLGGILIGFGARYAGGCTSGHAITGLSFLQLPSLLTVIGFFIGGLIMVHFILPLLI